MEDLDKNNLKSKLTAWKVDLEPDPMTSRHVLNRIASDRETASGPRPVSRIFTFLMGAGIAALVVLGTVYLTDQRAQRKIQQNSQYQVIIDPVTRAELHRDDLYSSDRLLNQLAWMQDRLDLSREQFLQLVELHTNYADTFNGLYQELITLEAEYENFEELRKSDQMVDFIALYEVLNTRRQTEDHAHKLSMELISRVSSILSPSQKTAYLSLINPDLKPNA